VNQLNELHDIEISIWIKPHHSFGFIKTLWVFEEDGKYSFVLRKQQDEARSRNSRENVIDEDNALEESNITEVSPTEIMDMLRAIKHNLLDDYENGKFGGSFYGIRIERDYQKTTYEWHGEMSTYDPAVVKLYEYIFNL
jgi:hypothetical protein